MNTAQGSQAALGSPILMSSTEESMSNARACRSLRSSLRSRASVAVSAASVAASALPRTKRVPPPRRAAIAGALVAALVSLSGCGSGGDDGGSTTPPPRVALKMQGTAATGAPIVAASVDAKCAAGTGSGTTGADGTFSVDVEAGTLPCVLRVTLNGGTALHSVAYGQGDSVRANLTPATELIVASLAAADPAAFYATFDSVAAPQVTAAAVASAQSFVVALLAAAGVDFGGLDLIASTFSASAADPYDAALVNLGSTLTSSGTSLSALTGAVVASSGLMSSVVALPPDMLLRAAATNCSSLRSGTYRVISPTPNATLAAQAGTLSLDATTMSVTRSDGSTGTWTANSACRFVDQGTGYSAEVVVTRAGVIVGRMTRGGLARDFIGFPEQTHTIDKFAGTWNTLGLEWSGSTFFATLGTVTINAGGSIVGGTDCTDPATWSIRNCVTVPAAIVALIPPFTADASGGFAVVDSGGAVSTRLFAYRAGSGDFMLVAVSGDGSFAVYAPDKAVVPPAVGTTTANWNFDSLASYVPAQPIYETANTVTASDSASWTRTQQSTGGVQYSNTLLANNPRRGYVHRDIGTVTATNGTSVTFNQIDLLRMHGMGFSPVLITNQKLFEWSVGKP